MLKKKPVIKSVDTLHTTSNMCFQVTSKPMKNRTYMDYVRSIGYNESLGYCDIYYHEDDKEKRVFNLKEIFFV